MTHTTNSFRVIIGVFATVIILAVGLVIMLTAQSSVDAAGTVLIRGTVKPGGATDSVNVFITHVASAPDPTAIRGTRTDISVGSAKKYKWIVEDGSLKKVRTASNPVPEKEVVVKGTLLDDGRIAASWMVQNYREFHVQGTLQGRDLDTGSIDEGYVTINVSKAVMRDVIPDRKFKEDQIKGKDLRVRVNGATKVRSIGKASDWTSVKSQVEGTKGSEVEIHLDEVSESQQQVVVEGQLINEDSWVASQYWQLNP